MQLFNLQMGNLGSSNYFLWFILILVGALPAFGETVVQVESNSSQEKKALFELLSRVYLITNQMNT